jgi:hypothetical protein
MRKKSIEEVEKNYRVEAFTSYRNLLKSERGGI